MFYANLAGKSTQNKWIAGIVKHVWVHCRVLRPDEVRRIWLLILSMLAVCLCVAGCGCVSVLLGNHSAHWRTLQKNDYLLSINNCIFFSCCVYFIKPWQVYVVNILWNIAVSQKPWVSIFQCVFPQMIKMNVSHKSLAHKSNWTYLQAHNTILKAFGHTRFSPRHWPKSISHARLWFSDFFF